MKKKILAILTGAALPCIGFSAAVINAAEVYPNDAQNTPVSTTTYIGSYDSFLEMYGFSVANTNITVESDKSVDLGISYDPKYYDEKSFSLRTEHDKVIGLSTYNTVTGIREGTDTITITARLKKDAFGGTLPKNETGVRTIKVKVNVIPNSDLSADQQQALARAWNYANLIGGEVPRIEKTIKGEISADAPRLTLEKAKQLIAEADLSCISADIPIFRAIAVCMDAKELFDEVHICCDATGGSGQTYYEYFLDDKGSERISLSESGSIWYTKVLDDGTLYGHQQLYPEESELYLNGYEVDYDYITINELECYDPENPVAGDVNMDGIFGVADVATFQRWLIGACDKNVPSYQKRLKDHSAADLNNDRKLDTFDLILMKKHLTGK